MTRRRTFDPTSVPLEFWRRDDVRLALVRREVGKLFAIYLGAHPDCTQTQVALLTQHDRCDVSNLVRGTRSRRVNDIDVLARIADGLAVPDEARVLLGLAPADVTLTEIRAGSATGPAHPAPRPGVRTGWFRPPDTGRPARLALCGSRAAGTDKTVMDDVVVALARLLMNRPCEVDHGPVGIGIEVITYIADHYRPPNLRAAVGIFGRANVVRNADLVLVVGGGSGTLDEIDVAVSMGKRILPFAASGGAARRAYEQMTADLDLRSWLSEQDFLALGACAQADDFARFVDQMMFASGEHVS